MTVMVMALTQLLTSDALISTTEDSDLKLLQNRPYDMF